MARQKMTSKKRMTPAQKYERLDRRYSDFTAGAISIHNAWLGFMVEQEAKGNSKATLDYYRRFYKKLKAFTDKLEAEGGETPTPFKTASKSPHKQGTFKG